MAKPEELIVVLHLDGQRSQAIARAIRELGVYSEIRSAAISPDELIQLQPKGIVLSGVARNDDGRQQAASPQGAESHSMPLDQRILELDLPLLEFEQDQQQEGELAEGEIEALRQFIYEDCQCSGTWNMAAFIEQTVSSIRAQVGSKRVLCALSGGVDSSVVAALIHRAIGDQLISVFVDHGLLREQEAESVVEMFTNRMRMNVIKVDAKKRFLDKLQGISDPEEKRKVIGHEFIYVFEEEASKLEDIHFLAQGTLYTDIMESGGATGEMIKSHHNVGGLPEKMKLDLIEPLAALFKDEVRRVGEELGLPEEIVWRQPFPGPGLAIRVLGEVTEEKLAIVRKADTILREEIKLAGLEREIWQYFTTLPNIRSVGVKSKRRTYDYTVGIRAVTSTEGTSAQWARIPYDVLDRISHRICNEVPGVNRVVYDITSKPPATIEWE